MNRELLQQCLEALDSVPDFVFFVGAEKIGIAIKAIKEALAKDEQVKATEGQLFRRVLKSKSSFPQYEPDVYKKIPVQRVPLSEEEIDDVFPTGIGGYLSYMEREQISRAIENAVYEKLGIR